MSTKTIHRLKEARLRSGITLRALAARTGIPVRVLQVQETSNDVKLTDLLHWQKALGVPMVELLNDPPEALDEMNRVRAGLLQLMRSIQSLQQTKLSEPQNAFLQNMRTTLQALMPELATIRPWPVYGDRRRSRALPRIESEIVATSIWCPKINET